MPNSVHGILQARTLEWVAMPSSRGSSQPRDQTQISCIAGGFFTVWATREAQEYWSGYPIPSPVDLPNPKLTWNAISTKERQFDPPLSPRDQEINLPVKVPPCARRLRRRPLSPEFEYLIWKHLFKKRGENNLCSDVSLYLPVSAANSESRKQLFGTGLQRQRNSEICQAH